MAIIEFEKYPVEGVVYRVSNKQKVSGPCINCLLKYSDGIFKPVKKCSSVRGIKRWKKCCTNEDTKKEISDDWVFTPVSGYKMEITGRPMVIGEL